MRRIAPLLASAFLIGPGTAPASHPITTSRVIVSTTLNDTLQIFDTASLGETQPPLPSKGGGPVRMWIQGIGARTYLFVANHSLGEGSVGVFNLSGETVTELPLSPFPARPGPVGITGAVLGSGDAERPIVFVTNTWFALGGCGMPRGSVTAYDATALPTLGVMEEIGTVETSAPIPWGVGAASGNEALAYVSTNCGDTVDTVEVLPVLCDYPPCAELAMRHREVRAAGDGPDGVIVDDERGLVFTANISGSSVSVHDLTSPGTATTVPLPGAGPIDIALADAADGSAWTITSNGRDDTVSLIDRDVVAACVAAAAPACPEAEVTRLPAAVKGGAPEGVAYDPVTGRIFVVNKTPNFSPSLSVIAVEPGSPPTGTLVGTVPLRALGASVPVGAVTAFDVVVQPGVPGHP